MLGCITYGGLVIRSESSVGSDSSAGHGVQLFDSMDSRADAVATFLREGVARGDSLLVVMKLEEWNLTAARFSRQELSLGDAFVSGQLTVRDAASTLERFMRGGTPDRVLFDDTMGNLVRKLASRANSLRIYGDMVDILATAGNFWGACQLEELWNKIAERESFALLCGYSAMNFGDPCSAEALRLICRAHSHVHVNPNDLLGTELLQAAGGHASHPQRASR